MFFILPIATIIQKSVHAPEVAAGFPNLATLPQECDDPLTHCRDRFERLHVDLTNRDNRTAIAVAARKLNEEVSGYRDLVLSTARALRKQRDKPVDDYEELITTIDARWQDEVYWHTLDRALKPYTPRMLLTTLDLRQAFDGSITSVPEDSRIFGDIIKRTVLLAGGITLIVLILGYVYAAAIHTVSSPFFKAVCLFSVMVPFWTSLLVRTSAWIVILQKEGILNSVLSYLQLISEPLALIFNRFGVVVVMTHVLLPFAVLPIYSVMKGISPVYTKAAASLGANPIQQFFRVYLPLTLPGVVSGGTITFIVALGYYITPALVGGPGDQMLGYYIAYFTNVELNVGMSRLSPWSFWCLWRRYWLRSHESLV